MPSRNTPPPRSAPLDCVSCDCVSEGVAILSITMSDQDEMPTGAAFDAWNAHALMPTDRRRPAAAASWVLAAALIMAQEIVDDAESPGPRSASYVAALHSVRDLDRGAFFLALLPLAVAALKREDGVSKAQHAEMQEAARHALREAPGVASKLAPADVLTAIAFIALALILASMLCRVEDAQAVVSPRLSATRPPPRRSRRAPRAPGALAQRTA